MLAAAAGTRSSALFAALHSRLSAEPGSTSLSLLYSVACFPIRIEKLRLTQELMRGRILQCLLSAWPELLPLLEVTLVCPPWLLLNAGPLPPGLLSRCNELAFLASQK